ncbi:hypothetical protein H632_c133p2 [Helicosporidium sp. ATCC 50920]|nr:hypothetical protein H632_c133p2 [Helicosporidium sp. ATCC 50920]|eukprot:KDD76705.1 hypothetical protein H632_c133p2 [Helicosporidium sp. ATCC 50920]
MRRSCPTAFGWFQALQRPRGSWASKGAGLFEAIPLLCPRAWASETRDLSVCFVFRGPRRFIQSSAWRGAPPSLGVVERLEDASVIQLPATQPRTVWEVVEFRGDGTVLETWKTAEVLGLHPRDASLFAWDSSLSRRAVLTPRPGSVLLRASACRAILSADRVILFPARRTADTLRVAQSLKTALSARSSLPFELRGLEALLSETVVSYSRAGRRLRAVAEAALADVTRDVQASASELQRMIPIQRKLAELQADVRGALDAVGDLAEDEDQLRALCLSDRAAQFQAVLAKRRAQAALERRRGGKEQRGVGSSSGSGSGSASHSGSHSGSESRSSSSPASASNSLAAETELPGPFEESTPESDLLTASDPHEERRRLETAHEAASASHDGDGGDDSKRSSPTSSSSSPPPSPAHASHSETASFPTHPPRPLLPRPLGQRSPHVRMASAILDSIETKLLAVTGELDELESGLEQAQAVWRMQLDHQRNRVLRVNLLLGIASFGMVTMTVPAAFFGMNLQSGLENAPHAMFAVAQASVALGLFLGGGAFAYYRLGPNRRVAAHLRDMRAVRDLLMFHLDDMEDVVQGLRGRGEVSRAEFEVIVASATRGRPFSAGEMELLYRVVRSDRDRFVEMSKRVRMEEGLDDFQATHFQ